MNLNNLLFYQRQPNHTNKTKSTAAKAVAQADELCDAGPIRRAAHACLMTDPNG
jgi:hypothetical protein